MCDSPNSSHQFTELAKLEPKPSQRRAWVDDRVHPAMQVARLGMLLIVAPLAVLGCNSAETDLPIFVTQARSLTCLGVLSLLDGGTRDFLFRTERGKMFHVEVRPRNGYEGTTVWWYRVEEEAIELTGNSKGKLVADLIIRAEISDRQVFDAYLVPTRDDLESLAKHIRQTTSETTE